MCKKQPGSSFQSLVVHPVGVAHGLEDAEISVGFKHWHKLIFYVYVSLYAQYISRCVNVHLYLMPWQPLSPFSLFFFQNKKPLCTPYTSDQF